MSVRVGTCWLVRCDTCGAIVRSEVEVATGMGGPEPAAFARQLEEAGWWLECRTRGRGGARVDYCGDCGLPDDATPTTRKPPPARGE